MKDTIQLHEIAGYLPYELKVMSEFGEVSEIDSINWSLDGHLRTQLNLCVQRSPSRFRGANLEHIKPILRPMSDLIGHIGLPSAIEDYLRGKGVKRTIDLPHWAIQYLSGLNHDNSHYDWQDLIGRGLALDINTLKD